MDFELTDDQLELQRVVREVAERECPPALVRAVVEDDADDATRCGRRSSTSTGPASRCPSSDGGRGVTAVELVVVLEELGRVADPTPFLATTSQYVPLVRERAARRRERGRCSARVCAGGSGRRRRSRPSR